MDMGQNPNLDTLSPGKSMKVAPLPAKKANPAGTKIYVSSKVVDALKKMKEHTE